MGRKKSKTTGQTDFRQFYLDRSDYKLRDEVWLKILNSLMSHVADDMVKGHVWELKYGLGSLQVCQNTKESDPISWAASTKRKKEILAQGLELYSKDNRDGVEWVVKRPLSASIFVYWDRKQEIGAKGIRSYRFHSARGVPSVLGRSLDRVNKDGLTRMDYKKVKIVRL